MATENKHIRLLLGGIYYFNQKNHLLDSYNQEKTRFKVLEDLKVKFVEYPMDTFLNFSPMLNGKI
jgi:hypothetical protein